MFNSNVLRRELTSPSATDLLLQDTITGERILFGDHQRFSACDHAEDASINALGFFKGIENALQLLRIVPDVRQLAVQLAQSLLGKGFSCTGTRDTIGKKNMFCIVSAFAGRIILSKWLKPGD